MKSEIVTRKLIVEFEVDGYADNINRTETPLCGMCAWDNVLLGFEWTDGEQVNCPFYDICHRNGCCFPKFKGFKLENK